jgi:hypothetical protein
MTPRRPIGVRQRGWGFLQGVFPSSYWSPGTHFFIAIWIRVKHAQEQLVLGKLHIYLCPLDENIPRTTFCVILQSRTLPFLVGRGGQSYFKK